ncbi:uncharacterized protein PV09_01758 [Verruconis gallopava]|uniref:Uncharacterized protein n=1 Tax=Verruconis gallopava TaxID=253628 RepID=A0A0D2AMU4_9PEZI|nr:uncharacterized protein PV09_01758 [Verruconis gallopava]KIW07840.1 hypothetical protein PV09_01758 [Verruconis gallopava]
MPIFEDMMHAISSEDAKDRFCAEIDRRLQLIRDNQTPSSDAGESWWPFPDSMHCSTMELHCRRSSVGHGSVFGRAATTLTPATSGRRPHGRSLSVQDIWHDANKDSKGNLAEPRQPRRAFSGRENTDLDLYDLYFAQYAQNARRPQLKTKRAVTNLRSTRPRPSEPGKTSTKGTGYEAFDDDTFGKRQPLSSAERRSSLLSLELQPFEDLIEEEKQARKRMEAFASSSGMLDRFGQPVRPNCDEGVRRDSGYDSACGDEEQSKDVDRATEQAELSRSKIPDYDFSQQNYTW